MSDQDLQPWMRQDNLFQYYLDVYQRKFPEDSLQKQEQCAYLMWYYAFGKGTHGGLPPPPVLANMPWYYVVVNLKPVISFASKTHYICDLLQRYVQRKYIGKYIYTYEQRGTTDDNLGNGVHLNIVFQLAYHKVPSQVYRETRNTFKDVIGNPLHVCFRSSVNPQNFISYILGQKKESKMDLVIRDRQWRLQLGLEDYYSNFIQPTSLIEPASTIGDPKKA